MENTADKIAQALEYLVENSRATVDDAVCPHCGGVVKFRRDGKWTVTISATCVGKEAGWCKYHDPCGFSISVKDSADLDAYMETYRQRFTHGTLRQLAESREERRQERIEGGG